MKPLINSERLIGTIMNFFATKETLNVLRAYQQLDSNYSEDSLIWFGRKLICLNSLSYNMTGKNFVTKRIANDGELIRLANEAYDAFNVYAAESAEDSYSKAVSF